MTLSKYECVDFLQIKTNSYLDFGEKDLKNIEDWAG